MCDDGDLCTSDGSCVLGECVVSVLVCDDDNLCMDDFCFDGCFYVNNINLEFCYLGNVGMVGMG